MLKMTAEYTCIHEEQIQEHGRTIERLDAELGYKKERLDDLKRSNERMEEKIDDIKECMNKLMLKSKTDDDKLQNRLTAIETELALQKKAQQDNLDTYRFWIAVVTVIFVILTFYFNYLK